MGIGRRSFLKMFGATIAAVASNALDAIVISEDIYINRALGVAFKKPKSWHFMSMRAFSDLRNAQVLMDDEVSEELRAAADPLVVMTKFHPEKNVISPAITVYVEPFQYVENETLIGFLPGLESTYQKSLKHYRQIGGPVEKNISGCESVEYLSEFLFEYKESEVMTRNRSLISVREPQIYTVNMFDYPALHSESQVEYDDFIKSIYYV